SRTHYGMPTDIGSFDYLTHPGVGMRGAASGDAEQFADLCTAMKHIGLHKRYQRHIFAVLGAVLSLGNLAFTYESQDGFDSAVVKNTDLLQQVSKVLGLDAIALETVLTNKTQTVGGESCTVYLDSRGAALRRDELARALYSLLFNWLVEFVNGRFCREDAERATFIGLLDFPGWHTQRRNKYEHLCSNYANERIHHFMFHQVFEVGNDEYAAEGIAAKVPQIAFPDRTGCLELFVKPTTGIFSIMDRQAAEILGQTAGGGGGRKGKGKKIKKREPERSDSAGSSREFTSGADERMAAFQLLSAFNKHNSGKGGDPNEFYEAVGSKNEMNSFTVAHFWGSVTYDVEGFVDKNLDQLSSDFVAAFRGDGTSENHGSRNEFVAGLFTDKSVATEVHPRNDKTVVQAQALAVPTRAPSMRVAKGRQPASRIKRVGSLATQFNRALSDLVTTLDETLPWFIVCVRSNDQAKPGYADARKVLGAVKGFALDDAARRKRVEFAAAMLPADFCERYSTVIAEAVPSASRLGDPLAMCRALKDALGFEDNEMAIGSSKVFMDFATWRRIDDPIRALERGGGGGRGDDDDDDGTRDMDEKTAIDGRSASRSGGANAVSFNVNRDGDAFGRALRERPQDTDARSFYSDDEAYHDILTKDAFSDILSEGGGFHAGFSDMLGAGDDGADRKGSFEGSVE
ncbi:hypothetical protein H4R21_005157, partial [Coemansia helicoidea]